MRAEETTKVLCPFQARFESHNSNKLQNTLRIVHNSGGRNTVGYAFTQLHCETIIVVVPEKKNRSRNIVKKSKAVNKTKMKTKGNLVETNLIMTWAENRNNLKYSQW